MSNGPLPTAMRAALVWGCGGPAPGAEPFDPPGWYRTVWVETAACAGTYRRTFETVTWWITPGPIPMGDGRGAAGAHLDGRIYLRADCGDQSRSRVWMPARPKAGGDA